MFCFILFFIDSIQHLQHLQHTTFTANYYFCYSDVYVFEDDFDVTRVRSSGFQDARACFQCATTAGEKRNSAKDMETEIEKDPNSLMQRMTKRQRVVAEQKVAAQLVKEQQDTDRYSRDDSDDFDGHY